MGARSGIVGRLQGSKQNKGIADASLFASVTNDARRRQGKDEGQRMKDEGNLLVFILQPSSFILSKIRSC